MSDKESHISINSPASTFNPIHVAIGIVFNDAGEVLIALRPPHVEQGDLWEFPGGKVEKGETAERALARELQEEVGIIVQSAKSLLQVSHQYPNKIVLLDVWQVEKFIGVPHACELQRVVKWVPPLELTKLNFPEADHLIIKVVLEIGK